MDHGRREVYAFCMSSFRQWVLGRQTAPPAVTRTVRIDRSRTLEALTRDVSLDQAVRRDDVAPGDVVVVRTRNSRYSMLYLGEGNFWVSGGWFDQEGVSPTTMTVNGCTWGGSVIKTDIVAGPGLCLEFGNRVVTTRIQSVHVIKSGTDGSVH